MYAVPSLLHICYMCSMVCISKLVYHPTQCMLNMGSQVVGACHHLQSRYLAQPPVQLLLVALMQARQSPLHGH